MRKRSLLQISLKTSKHGAYMVGRHWQKSLIFQQEPIQLRSMASTLILIHHWSHLIMSYTGWLTWNVPSWNFRVPTYRTTAGLLSRCVRIGLGVEGIRISWKKAGFVIEGVEGIRLWIRMYIVWRDGEIIVKVYQQNVNRSGSQTQTFQTLRSTSPVLLNNSICSQAPLNISKVLSDSARAFSGVPESTYSYGGAFRMQRYLTYRIMTFWSGWDLCAGLRETWCCILTAVVR